MSKQISKAELDELLKIIAGYDSGININDILINLNRDIPKSNITRRINQLIGKGLIEVIGAGKTTKYRALKASRALLANADSEKVANTTDLIIPLSAEAREIAELTRRPIQRRTPIGYDRNILDMYKPNITRYISHDITMHLLSLGSITEVIDIRPAGTYARQILDRLLIDLSWNSSRLEGNTYSLLDTRKLISEGIGRNDKNSFETQMILNHKAAIEFLVEGAEDIGFNQYTIKNLHALISDNLLENPYDCGRIRTFPVGIEGSVYIPTGIPQLIAEHFEMLLAKAELITDPFEQSFFVMAQIPYLQPFVDGNKRTSRMAANIPFIKKNLSPLSFIDVPEKDYTDALIGFYELGRIEMLRDLFIWAYGRSSLRYKAIRQSLGDPDPFRLKYRQEIIDIVNNIVKNLSAMDNVRTKIQTFATKHVDSENIDKFINVIEYELAGLHEGNFARFRLRPSEFKAWVKHNKPL